VGKSLGIFADLDLPFSILNSEGLVHIIPVGYGV
jgi:hypothetical protein